MIRNISTPTAEHYFELLLPVTVCAVIANEKLKVIYLKWSHNFDFKGIAFQRTHKSINDKIHLNL